MKKTLTPKEEQRYKLCTDQILECLQSQFDGGIALIEVRDKKLYRDDFETLEDYCSQVLKISRSRAYQLIDAAQVKASLPEKVGEKIVNEGQARALAPVPENMRLKVVREAEKTGPITAASISAAASKMSTAVDKNEPIESGKPSKTPPQNRDKTGYLIPAKIQPLWDQATEELGALLSKISAIRSEVRKIMDADDGNPIWRKPSANSVMLYLDNAYNEISGGVPYAVCPYCQGQVSKNCTGCRQTGYIGKAEWGTHIPRELIAIRQKSCAA